MSNSVAKAECETVSSSSSSYRELFEPYDDEKLNRAFYEDYSPVGWTGHNIVRLDSSKADIDVESGTVTLKYTNSKSHKFTVMTTMALIVPTIELLDENVELYRFKIVDYVGYKAAEQAYFGSSECEVNLYDTHDQIFKFERFTKPGHYEKLLKSMGMKTICKDWCYDTIPKTTLFYRQMFGYSLWECKAWPVYLQDKLEDVFYRYKYEIGRAHV